MQTDTLLKILTKKTKTKTKKVDTRVYQRDALIRNTHPQQLLTGKLAVGDDSVDMTQHKTHGPVFQPVAPGSELLPVRIHHNFAQGDTPPQPRHQTLRQRAKRMDRIKTERQHNPKRQNKQTNIHRKRFRLEPRYPSQIQAVNGIGMDGVHVTRARHIGGHYMYLFSAEPAIHLGRPHCGPAYGRKKKFGDNQYAHY